MSASPQPAARPYACEREGANSRLCHLLDGSSPRRLQFVAALAYETGISLHDACELRLTSFDLLRRQIGVQDTNGIHTWYYVLGTETLIQFVEWLRERDAGTDDGVYGLLLHDDSGAPCTPEALVEEFSRYLAPAYAKWDDHPDGLQHFEVEDLYA